MGKEAAVFQDVIAITIPQGQTKLTVKIIDLKKKLPLAQNFIKVAYILEHMKEHEEEEFIMKVLDAKKLNKNPVMLECDIR